MMIKPEFLVWAAILMGSPLLSHGSYQADSLYPVRAGYDTTQVLSSVKYASQIRRNGESGTRLVKQLPVTDTSSRKPCREQLLREAACLAMEWGKSAY